MYSRIQKRQGRKAPATRKEKLMLSEARKITIEQKAKIGEKEVIGFRAVFSDGGDVTFLPYQIDKE